MTPLIFQTVRRGLYYIKQHQCSAVQFLYLRVASFQSVLDVFLENIWLLLMQMHSNPPAAIAEALHQCRNRAVIAEDNDYLTATRLPVSSYYIIRRIKRFQQNCLITSWIAELMLEHGQNTAANEPLWTIL